jgi:ectoine hydroxylase-related dioxygenase (phytanoyl-CoA dioxygenase family)
VDAGKHCSKVVELALNSKVISILKLIYRKNPIPFSTINFLKGTEQPIHSDTIHFGSIPKGYLAACWVALEDVDENNGALQIVEGSHKLKDIDYYDLKIQPAKNTKLCEKIYREYENYVSELISVNGMERITVPLKKGHALIWSANLLHGGAKIKENNRTRYSQVTHYNFEGCEHYFLPFFSVPPLGKYINRDLSTIDIRNYKD